MAKRLSLTRPELKRQRDMLARFKRYLPMLKLKQQQFQVALRETERAVLKAQARLEQAAERFSISAHLADAPSGIPLAELAQPKAVRTSMENVAGVNVVRFEGADFAAPVYSLFGTPVWVDQVLSELRAKTALEAELDVLEARRKHLQQELSRALQRVNLFEKVKIPAALEAIRRIRIQLGDEMAAGVARAKIAKAKLARG